MTKEEYVNARVAAEKKRAEAYWEEHSKTYNYKERFINPIQEWTNRRCEAHSQRSWQLYSNIVSLARMTAGIRGNRRVEGEDLDHIVKNAEAFMELFDELKGGVKS